MGRQKSRIAIEMMFKIIGGVMLVTGVIFLRYRSAAVSRHKKKG